MKLPSKAKYLEIEYMFFYFPSFNDCLLLRQLGYGPVNSGSSHLSFPRTGISMFSIIFS